jgi:predicted methyltransferase
MFRIAIAAVVGSLFFTSLSTAQVTATDAALTQAIASDSRPAEQRARDGQRHPAESLSFWGLKPGMKVLEVQPGGAPGWWTEILASYLKQTSGSLTVTAPDLDDAATDAESRADRVAFLAYYNDKPKRYGRIEAVNWGPKSAPLPSEQFDFILTARSVHGWMGNEASMPIDKVFADFFRTLKPGGILAVEQHRANPGTQDPQAESGYVTEAFVIQQAEKAGFKLESRSEINANPKDTKDHPFGVWTLPPSRQSTPFDSDGPPAANFDRAKYDAIGESDRMTLRFRKPE